MTQQYYTKLNQNTTYVIIDIQIDPRPLARMTVFKRLEYVKGLPNMLPAYIRFPSFGECDLTQVDNEILPWIKAAHDVAADLDRLIKTHQDFARALVVEQRRGILGAYWVESEAPK